MKINNVKIKYENVVNVNYVKRCEIREILFVFDTVFAFVIAFLLI